MRGLCTARQKSKGIKDHLLSTFVLPDLVPTPMLILPLATGGLSMCGSDEWDKNSQTRNFQQFAQHNPSLHGLHDQRSPSQPSLLDDATKLTGQCPCH